MKKEKLTSPLMRWQSVQKEDSRSYYEIECILSSSPTCTKLIMLDSFLGQNFPNLNGTNSEAVTPNRCPKTNIFIVVLSQKNIYTQYIVP